MGVVRSGRKSITACEHPAPVPCSEGRSLSWSAVAVGRSGLGAARDHTSRVRGSRRASLRGRVRGAPHHRHDRPTRVDAVASPATSAQDEDRYCIKRIDHMAVSAKQICLRVCERENHSLVRQPDPPFANILKVQMPGLCSICLEDDALCPVGVGGVRHESGCGGALWWLVVVLALPRLR